MNEHIVFVYGSLMAGGRLHEILEGSGRLGAAIAPGPYAMISVAGLLGGFPALIPDPDGYPVLGECYVVDDGTLSDLDRVESEGSLYRRVPVPVLLADHGWDGEAHCYLWANDDGDGRDVVEPVHETLSWRAHTRTQS